MNEYSQVTMNSADVCIAPLPQHWNANDLSDQVLSLSNNLSDEILSNQPDKNSNKTQTSTAITTINTIDESEHTSSTMMKKRVTPVPASYLRRRPNSKSNVPDSNLSLQNKQSNSKKSSKPSPIFIAPKKTTPQPHPFSSLSFDDVSYNKRKAVLERQTALHDDVNTTSMNNSSRSNKQAKFYIQSSSSEIDENSSDESDHESLLIRKKKTTTLTQMNSNHSPLVICITDPSGNSFTYDPDNITQHKNDHNDQTIMDDSGSIDINTLGPNTTIDSSTTPDITVIPPTPPIKHDKHILHSIGEEEEEEEEEEQEQEQDAEQKDCHNIAKEPLSRRWSDEPVKQDPNESSSPPSVSLNQLPTVLFTPKQTEITPTKLSKTKYILMKLHLTSSSKDDDTDISLSKRRTVQRSADKKRYQTQ